MALCDLDRDLYAKTVPSVRSDWTWADSVYKQWIYVKGKIARKVQQTRRIHDRTKQPSSIPWIDSVLKISFFLLKAQF